MPLEPSICIDTGALRHNLAVARSQSPDSRIMAVIKANGYGHGMHRMAQALDQADALAVARVGEALALRAAGIRTPLVVLEGFLDQQELHAAAAAELTLVLHQPYQIQLVEQTTLAKPLACWLKVDTGMNRLGVSPEEAPHFYRVLSGLPGVKGEPGLMTHLAKADQPDDGYNGLQLERFMPFARQSGAVTSIANSAALLRMPQSHSDWNRPGLMLYGVSPFSDITGAQLGLKPVMHFTAPLIAIKQLKKGDSVGYGGTWQAPRDMSFGVIGAGYGDGYPRELRGSPRVLLDGKYVPVVGRVSMDMITLDMSTVPEARVGDRATLWVSAPGCRQ